MKIRDLLEPYLKSERPSLSVEKAVCGSWPKFLAFCEQHDLVQVAQIRRRHVEDFHRDLLWGAQEQGRLYKANSVDQFVRRVRQVLRWAFREGLVRPDPTCGLLLPRPVQPQIGLLNWAQLQELWAVPDRSTPRGLRDALLLHLLAETNLGVSGLLSLRLETVAGLELESATQELLDAYLREGRPALGGQGNELFLSRGGDPLSHPGVLSRLKEAARHIGLKSLPARVLRKSYLSALEQVHRRHPSFS